MYFLNSLNPMPLVRALGNGLLALDRWFATSASLQVLDQLLNIGFFFLYLYVGALLWDAYHRRDQQDGKYDALDAAQAFGSIAPWQVRLQFAFVKWVFLGVWPLFQIVGWLNAHREAFTIRRNIRRNRRKRA